MVSVVRIQMPHEIVGLVFGVGTMGVTVSSESRSRGLSVTAGGQLSHGLNFKERVCAMRRVPAHRSTCVSGIFVNIFLKNIHT